MNHTFQFVKGVWKLLVLFALNMITFSYAMFQGGFVSWFLFYSFLPFSLYALCLVLYPLADFTVERKLQKWNYHANEVLNMKLIFKRKSFFPLLFIIVEDCLPEAWSENEYKEKNKIFLFPGFRRSFSLDFHLENLTRGEHHFQGVTILTSDPLGLIEKKKNMKTNEKILVYPAYEELHSMLFEHYGQGRSVSRNRIQKETSIAVGIREYKPGDRYSWINWKASARRNEMITKEFEQHQSDEVFIIMDGEKNHRFEIIVSFTASLGRAILQKKAPVGFLFVGDQKVSLSIQASEMSEMNFFTHLAKCKDNSPVPLNVVLATENFILHHKKTLILVTAHLSTSLIEAADRLTATKKNNVTIFLIKTREESETPSEFDMRTMAQARGICVILIREGQFSSDFAEVGKG